MSIHERRAIVSIISTIVINLVYITRYLPAYPNTSAYSAEAFRFWGSFFVGLIVVTIIAKIIIAIVFSILNTIITREPEPTITDERDHLIELRANRYGFYLFAAGFVVSLVAVASGQSPAVMFVMLLGAGIVSDIASDGATFFFYQRGF